MTAHNIGRFEILGNGGQGTAYPAQDNLYEILNRAANECITSPSAHNALIDTGQAGLERSRAHAQAMHANIRA